MASNYNVVISDDAQSDLDSLFDYICNTLYAEKAAERIIKRIVQSIRDLSLFPKKGVETSITAYDGTTYRTLIIENYIVLYLVYDTAKTVKVVRVVDGRTNYNI